jgi:hypothetical protein
VGWHLDPFTQLIRRLYVSEGQVTGEVVAGAVMLVATFTCEDADKFIATADEAATEVIRAVPDVEEKETKDEYR